MADKKELSEGKKLEESLFYKKESKGRCEYGDNFIFKNR